MQKCTGRMTLEQLALDMRARNVPIDKNDLSTLIANGTFPIGTVLKVTTTGHRNILVLASDYYPWADQKLGPYVEEVAK